MVTKMKPLPLYTYFKKSETEFPEGTRVKRENIYPWMSGSAAEVSQVRTSPRNSLPRNTTCSPINKIITYNLNLRSHLGAGRFHLQEWNLINEKYSDYLQYKVCVIQNVICRDEDPDFFSTDPDLHPAQLKKNSGSGSDPKSKWRKKYIYMLGR